MPDQPTRKNISRLTDLEQELLDTNASYRDMVEQSWDGIIVHDNQAIHFANASFRKMFGLSGSESLEDLHLHRILAPDTRRSLFLALKEAEHATDAPVFFEGHGIRPDGSFFDLEFSLFPTTYKGNPALQTVLRDISQRKQMEDRLLNSERLAATGKLAFNIAHEINNPLGGIITYTHLLLEDLEEGATQEELGELGQKILKLSNRCKIIVSALLDFARKDRDIMEEINLNKVMSETLTLLSGHIILNGISVDEKYASCLPLVRADRNKIEQVFMNLTVNAAEAMEGHGRLTLETGFDRNEKHVFVKINDTGPGVDEENMKLLFEPFFSTKPRGRGTGLGLSISHGIIKQHKGTIDVESDPGQGTAFIVRLPFEEPVEK